MERKLAAENDKALPSQMVPISEIWIDSEWNCRGTFSPATVFDLVKSIKEPHGLIQPVSLAPIGPKTADKAPPGTKYRLVAGYRRVMAHKVLDRTEIRATIDPTLTDNIEAQALVNFAENLVRKQLDIMQEARTVMKLFSSSVSDKEVAEKLNVSTGWVLVRRIVLEQPPEIQKHIADESLNQEQIKKLQYMPPEDKMTFIKTILEAKARGESTRQVVAPKKKAEYQKKIHRKPGEISEMLDEIVYPTFGGSIATRLLAWAIGRVSYVELFADLHEEATAQGVTLDIPNECFSDVMAEEAFRKARKRMNKA